uniref:Putative secreted peptide n=1 Tax=Anopheles braziliensis TaxID=58242 RepID=A0A2M3ZNX0_9DIPT
MVRFMWFSFLLFFCKHFKLCYFYFELKLEVFLFSFITCFETSLRSLTGGALVVLPAPSPRILFCCYHNLLFHLIFFDPLIRAQSV